MQARHSSGVVSYRTEKNIVLPPEVVAPVETVTIVEPRSRAITKPI